MPAFSPLPDSTVRLAPWPRAVGAAEEGIRSICADGRAALNDLPADRAQALARDLLAGLLEGVDQAWTEHTGEGNDLLYQPQRAFLLIHLVTRTACTYQVHGRRITLWHSFEEEPQAGAVLWRRLLDLPSVLLRMLAVSPSVEEARRVVHGLLGVATVLLDAPGDLNTLLPTDLVQIGGDAMSALYPEG